MNLDDYYSWQSMARQFSRIRDDADDLLQDSLLIAFEQGKLDFTNEQNRKWFTGVLKNRAAMAARSESRRKKREESVAQFSRPSPPSAPEIGCTTEVETHLLNELPSAARRVTALILSGLSREEVCSALNLSPPALRQRLTTIRKVLRRLPDDLQREALALAYKRSTARAEDLAFGLIRRALHRLLQQEPGVGTHDPDGHLLVIRSK